MAKWFGKIGYAITNETENGVWEDEIFEHSYYGDLIVDRRKRQSSGNVNDNVNIANTISIVADPFAMENCSNMVYVEFMGNKWKVTDVGVEYPRLLLTVGGVYNGNAD